MDHIQDRPSARGRRRKPGPPLQFLLDHAWTSVLGLLALVLLCLVIMGLGLLLVGGDAGGAPSGPADGWWSALAGKPLLAAGLLAGVMALLGWAVVEHMRRGRILLSILEHDTTAVALRDAKGRLLFANRAFRNLLREPGRQRLDQVLQGGGEDVSALLPVGRRWVRLRGRPVRKGHRDEGSLIIGLDETALHEAGEGRRFRAFAGLITHELKTPMTPLRLGLDQIQREVERLQQPLPENLQRVLGRMRADLDSMTRLLRQFMSLAGERQVRERVDLLRVVDLAMRRNGLRQLPFVESHVHCARPAAWVRGDEEMLAMLVGGLVANALEAMESRGRIDFTLEPSPEAGEPEFWELDVRDNGPGVPPEVLDRIWEPGFSSRPGGGSGYGLYFARTVVLDLHGQIRLIRPPEGGALFRLSLPAWSEDGEAPEQATGSGEAAEGHATVAAGQEDHA